MSGTHQAGARSPRHLDASRSYAEFAAERIRAHEKHDDRGQSMERRRWSDGLWLPVLVEEVGEVAKALCEWNGTDRALIAVRNELVQVGAMTAAWIDAVDDALPLVKH